MKSRMKISISISIGLFLLFGLNQSLLACELTNEYKELKWELVKSAREATSECEHSIVNVNFWYALSQCVTKQHEGKISKGFNCSREASHNSKDFIKHEIDPTYCDTFKPGSRIFGGILEEAMLRRGIKKCKKHNKAVK